MYRKKKAELLHRQNIVTPVQTDAVDSSVKNKNDSLFLLIIEEIVIFGNKFVDIQR